MKTISKQIPGAGVLAARNVHQSIYNACEDYGLKLSFLPSKLDNKLQIFIPNTVTEIVECVKKNKPDVLMLTLPTYEGLTIDLREVVKQVRQINKKTIIFIDEAWGAHLSFSEELPTSAMEAGVDICTQSTHKQGGSLQQTSMIHLKGKRVNEQLLMASYRSLSTTSPSFILLASLDSAREVLENEGASKIKGILSIADLLRNEITRIIGLKVIDREDLDVGEVIGMDRTKVIVDVRGSGLAGCFIAKRLEEDYGIVVEMYTDNILLFVVPFQAMAYDVRITGKALETILNEKKYKSKKFTDFKVTIPSVSVMWNMSATVGRMLESELVSLEEAVDRICAELITPYPPGIPLTVKGEVLTDDVIKYYKHVRSMRSYKVNSTDPTLKNILVVKGDLI